MPSGRSTYDIEALGQGLGRFKFGGAAWACALAESPNKQLRSPKDKKRSALDREALARLGTEPFDLNRWSFLSPLIQ